MPSENGRSNGGTGSLKYAAGLALGVLGVSATIAAGIGRYSGWEGAKDAITPEIVRFDARVSAARAEDEKRREEIRAEAIEQRREVEERLRAEIAREREEARDRLSGLQDRLERIEALVYGRSGGAR